MRCGTDCLAAFLIVLLDSNEGNGKGLEGEERIEKRIEEDRGEMRAVWKVYIKR